MPRLETLQIPGGADGKVLTSDASGNGTWQTPAGGGGGAGEQWHSAALPNLCTNPGFEVNTADWDGASSYWLNAGATLTRITESLEGAGACLVVSPGSLAQQGARFVLIPMTAGRTYRATAHLQAVSGTSILGYGIGGAPGTAVQEAALTSAWAPHTIEMTAAATAVGSLAIYNTGATPTSFRIDKVRIVEYPPAATGVVGDWFLDTASGDVYEKTGASTWTWRMNLTGPQGLKGSRIPQVTAFPPGPVNGDEVYKALSAAPWHYHHYRYNAGWGDAYKWEAVGGPGWLVEVIGPESKSASPTVYGDLATVGPQIVIDHAGLYYVEFGAYARTGTVGASAFVAMSGAGLTPSDGDAAQWDTPVANYGGSISFCAFRTLTVGTLKLAYRASAGVPLYSRRWLKVTPIRLAP